jgi:hypothetical protein
LASIGTGSPWSTRYEIARRMASSAMARASASVPHSDHLGKRRHMHVEPALLRWLQDHRVGMFCRHSRAPFEPPLPFGRGHPMVGILNSAPARMPVGQRDVIAFCLV